MKLEEQLNPLIIGWFDLDKNLVQLKVLFWSVKY